jgi:hypothetical protein
MRRFPLVPIRGVHVRHVPIGNCGPFYDVTVDYEPADAEGVTLEFADGIAASCPFPEDVPRFFDFMSRGIREELERDEYDDVTVAVHVILQRTIVHKVDTGERAFQRAGRDATRKALAIAFEADNSDQVARTE